MSDQHIDLWAKAAALEEGEAIAVPLPRGRFPEIPEPQPTPTWRPVIVGGTDMDERGNQSPDQDAQAAFLAGPKS